LCGKQEEYERQDSAPVYQLMIALDNLGENIFNKDRKGGSSSFEIDLNMRDAKKYLESQCS
jgi:hypothetical protein